MSEKTKPGVISSLVAGAFAGAVAKTTIAPLDRTKINFQRALRFLRRCVQQEGILSLWRGNSATMARIVPYAAIQYSSHEQWKQILYPSGEKYVPPGPRFLAGSLAGVTSSTATYPLDMVRARLAVTDRSKYAGLLDIFRSIKQEEGIHKLFRGYVPTVLGVIPYAGSSFFTYESLKKIHNDRYAEDPHPVLRLGFGAVAGAVGQASSYPLDIIRRRMQTAGLSGQEQTYGKLIPSILHVYRTEGLKGGLFKGLSMNFIKGPIAVGVSFMTFDLVHEQLKRSR